MTINIFQKHVDSEKCLRNCCPQRFGLQFLFESNYFVASATEFLADKPKMPEHLIDLISIDAPTHSGSLRAAADADRAEAYLSAASAVALQKNPGTWKTDLIAT